MTRCNKGHGTQSEHYRRKIEEHEKSLPDPHDVAAARAVLEEVKED